MKTRAWWLMILTGFVLVAVADDISDDARVVVGALMILFGVLLMFLDERMR